MFILAFVIRKVLSQRSRTGHTEDRNVQVAEENVFRTFYMIFTGQIVKDKPGGCQTDVKRIFTTKETVCIRCIADNMNHFIAFQCTEKCADTVLLVQLIQPCSRFVR